MYFTENIIGTSLLKNIIDRPKHTINSGIFVQAMLSYPGVKKEIIEWADDNNMSVSALIYFDSISILPHTSELRDFTYSEWGNFSKIVLRFNSIEEHNLFKLTWG